MSICPPGKKSILKLGRIFYQNHTEQHVQTQVFIHIISMSGAHHNLILGWSQERVNISYAVTRVLGMSSLPLSLCFSHQTVMDG